MLPGRLELRSGTFDREGGLALDRGVSFNLDTFMAAQADGLYFDTTITSSTWQDTSAVTPADDVGEAIGRIDDQRTGTGSPHNGTQGTGTLKPLRQTTGAKFDGSDDNWLTSYTAGAGENFIVALVDVPASVPATQAVAGVGGGSIARCYLGLNNSGRLLVGAGSTGISQNLGDIDLRGQTLVVGMALDGSVVRGFSDNEMVTEAAQPSAVNTTRAFTIGCANGDSSNFFFSGSIKKLVAGRQFLDLATYRKIRTALLA